MILKCIIVLLVINIIYSDEVFESSVQKLRRKLKENGIFDADSKLTSKSLIGQYENFSDKVEFKMGIRARQPTEAQAPKEIMDVAEKIFHEMAGKNELSDEFIKLFKW